MTELEDAVREALRSDAERAVGEVDLQQLLRARRRARSSGVGRVLAAAAAVAVIAAMSFGIALHHSRTERTPSPPPATTSKIGGLVFTLPRDGRFVGVNFLTGALFQPIGWIINQTPKPECEQQANSGTCHGPYTSLVPGQYAVSFQAGPDITKFRATTTIAGLPAAEGSTNGECQYGFSMSIRTSGYRHAQPEGQLLAVTACFGSNDPKLMQAIKTMIISARR